MSRVEVTVDPDALNRSVVTNLSSKPVLPGTRVRCTVEEVLPTVFQQETGHAHDN